MATPTFPPHLIQVLIVAESPEPDIHNIPSVEPALANTLMKFRSYIANQLRRNNQNLDSIPLNFLACADYIAEIRQHYRWFKYRSMLDDLAKYFHQNAYGTLNNMVLYGYTLPRIYLDNIRTHITENKVSFVSNEHLAYNFTFVKEYLEAKGQDLAASTNVPSAESNQNKERILELLNKLQRLVPPQGDPPKLPPTRADERRIGQDSIVWRPAAPPVKQHAQQRPPSNTWKILPLEKAIRAIKTRKINKTRWTKNGNQ
jgi:hypothetical protein